MRCCAFEIETVALLKMILLTVQRDLKLALQDMEEFFAFVTVRFAATRVWRDAE